MYFTYLKKRSKIWSKHDGSINSMLQASMYCFPYDVCMCVCDVMCVCMLTFELVFLEGCVSGQHGAN